jgi:hypothetical protein
MGDLGLRRRHELGCDGRQLTWRGLRPPTSMPIIYLRHPRHGEKVAISDMEAEYDEQNGWTRYTPGESQPEPVNELRPRRRREAKDAELL